MDFDKFFTKDPTSAARLLADELPKRAPIFFAVRDLDTILRAIALLDKDSTDLLISFSVRYFTLPDGRCAVQVAPPGDEAYWASLSDHDLELVVARDLGVFPDDVAMKAKVIVSRLRADRVFTCAFPRRASAYQYEAAVRADPARACLRGRLETRFEDWHHNMTKATFWLVD
eukprot:tig00020539_g10403.t1